MALPKIEIIGLSSCPPGFKQECNAPLLAEWSPVHGLKIRDDGPVLHILSYAAFTDSKCFSVYSSILPESISG
jgi:hypothetical protein